MTHLTRVGRIGCERVWVAFHSSKITGWFMHAYQNPIRPQNRMASFPSAMLNIWMKKTLYQRYYPQKDNVTGRIFLDKWKKKQHYKVTVNWTTRCVNEYCSSFVFSFKQGFNNAVGQMFWKRLWNFYTLFNQQVLTNGTTTYVQDPINT